MAVAVSQGGALNPYDKQRFRKDVQFDADVTVDGDLTVEGTINSSGDAFLNPVITGTVTGGASYTAPTLTSPTITGTTSIGATATITAPVLSGSITGTYTLAGTPTITSPTISGPTLSGSVIGTYTLAGTPTITSPTISGPTLSGTVAGTYTLGGTPTLASAAGVPYVGGVAAGYKLARSAAPVAVTATSDITTGLTSVIAAGCNSEAALDGDTIANCSVTITGGAGHILLQTWKVTTGGAAGNPTLIAGSVAKNLTWWAIGT